MSRKRSADGSSVGGGFIFVVIVLIAMVPKPVWTSWHANSRRDEH